MVEPRHVDFVRTPHGRRERLANALEALSAGDPISALAGAVDLLQEVQAMLKEPDDEAVH